MSESITEMSSFRGPFAFTDLASLIPLEQESPVDTMFAPLKFIRHATSLVTLTSACFALAQRIDIPLNPGSWISHAEFASTKPSSPSFEVREGFPQGLVQLSEGSIQLRNFDFASGTIDFDMKVTGDGLPGIRFRMQGERGAENSEEFYLRPSVDCRASDDCVQYAPIINGFMLWNVFPEYQTQAPVYDGWNHFKLVISGRRMNLYVNHFPEPVLKVGKLESSSSHGTIGLVGPAQFANLTIRAGQVDGLLSSVAPDRSDNDRSIVHHWELGSSTPFHLGKPPAFSDVPSQAWKPVSSERFGFVNLNRLYSAQEVSPELTWLRFSVWSEKSQTKTMSLGWIGQAWIFVNGSFLTTKKNFYYPEAERQPPDGRYSLENGTVQLVLKPGRNIVTFAVYDSIRNTGGDRTRYGWGVGASFRDTAGLRF